jgi:hypothetical protein
LIQAELSLSLGALDEAAAAARAALSLAERGRTHREEALARRLLGQCAQADGNLTEAEEQLRQALAIFEEIGALLERDRTQLALAGALTARPTSAAASEEANRLRAAADASIAARAADSDES